jgi:starvation-inducible DNA-binding protein
MQLNTGISGEHRQKIVEGLEILLADSYTLYLKTHNFHWNVTGPMFQALHVLFENQYTELALAVDEIAERIRALGHFAPGSYAQFMKHTSIKEETTVPPAKEMILQLLEGQEIIIRTARKACTYVEESNDQATMDLLTRRIETHEKNAWMLRSLLE